MRLIDDNLIDSMQEVLLPAGRTFDDERRNYIKNFTSCDLLAVPGSGKTTALIAKLCCMANNIESGDTILVLSHTNTAVDEIKKNLVGKGAKLLDYPHCVSTIQEFVDKFLAIPYYENKFKNRIDVIDKGSYDVEMQRRLARCHDSRVLYCSHQFDFNSVRFSYDQHNTSIVLGIEGHKISYRIPCTWRGHEYRDKQFVQNWLFNTKMDILQSGILHYDDCYYLAEEYLQKHPEIIKVLQNRFKYILIDETQDLQQHQLRLIDKLFYGSNCILQRIGDPNQSIYNTVTDTCAWEPRNPVYINNSLRLTKEVADVVNPFTLEKGDDGYGNARFVVNGTNTLDQPIAPVLLLFNEATIPLLKDKFRELIKKNNLPDTINGKKYGFHIIGWNARALDSGFKIEKLRLDNIFPNTAKRGVSVTKTYTSISEYLQFCSNKTIGACYMTVLRILCRILRFSPIVDSNGRNFTTKTLPKQYHNNDLEDFNRVMLKVSLCIYSKDFINAYRLLYEFINTNLFPKFGVVTNESIRNFIGDTYVEYDIDTDDEIEEFPIQIGTVHSVKGMTHCATMYIETFYHEYECNHLIKRKRNGDFESTPFFKENIIVKTSRGKQAMKMLYVGMSRPTDLLCYATLKQNWTIEALDKMKACGWDIFDITI